MYTMYIESGSVTSTCYTNTNIVTRYYLPLWKLFNLKVVNKTWQ